MTQGIKSNPVRIAPELERELISCRERFAGDVSLASGGFAGGGIFGENVRLGVSLKPLSPVVDQSSSLGRFFS